MEIKDLILAPIYLILLYLVAYFLRPFLTSKNTKKYFIPALTVKFIGAIGVGLVYFFYYKGGDTINYYEATQPIYQAFQEKLSHGLSIVFSKNDYSNPQTLKYTRYIWHYYVDSEFLVIRIAALIGFIGFKSYTIIALFFAFFSFLSLWLLYKTFLKIYPLLFKEFAIAIFFIPTVFFWGSGLMKDTIAIAGVGLLFYSFFNIFFERNKILSSSMIFIFSFFLLFTVKKYIILAFLPSLLFWIFYEYNKKIKVAFVRKITYPVFIILGIALAYYGADKIGQDDPKYNLSQLGERSKATAEWIHYVSVQEGGSGYYLGKLDGSLTGLIKLFPQAINVSLFRPYPWEIKNLLMMLSSLESLLLLYFTLKTFLSIGILKSLKMIRDTPFLQFCFLFSIIFAFAVGISSYNFGTLVRYKIPLIPFYLTALFILSEKIKGYRSPN